MKKRLWYNCFPVNLAKFLKTPFLQNTSGQLLLFLAFQNQLPKVFYEKRCSWKFTGKHLWFAKFLRTTFLQNTSGWLLLTFPFNFTKMGHWRTSANNCFCTALTPFTVIYLFYFIFLYSALSSSSSLLLLLISLFFFVQIQKASKNLNLVSHFH